MADNPWHKYGSSPWVLMIGSGEIGDFWENYEGFGHKKGRTADFSYRPFAVAFLKLTLDHVLKLRPRLISDPKVVRGKYDFYFGSRTNNRVIAFQHLHHLTADGIVGKQTMGVIWDIGRSDPIVREHERGIRENMLAFIRLNLSSYKRVDRPDPY